MDIAISILEQGFIFSIMAFGIYISYKILDFPDLSVDGTFPLGAAISSSMITAGQNPWLCLLLSFVAGAAAGAVTGLLNVKLKIKDLLSGILVMLAMYTVNYSIAGKPNEFLMGQKTIFNSIPFAVPKSVEPFVPVIIIIIIAIVVKFLLDWYLSTKSGFLLKCAGDNTNLVVLLGKDPGVSKIIGLSLANGLVALAGAINCQKNVQFDITSGTGTMVMGLAAVIIGTTLFKKKGIVKTTTAVIVGMIIYKGCITLAFALGLPSHFLNLMMAVLFLVPPVMNSLFSDRREA